MSLRRVEQIIYIKIPVLGIGKTQRHIAYVEFGDEEAMKAALAKKGEVSVTCGLLLWYDLTLPCA